jgi:hypothetical protein
MAERDTWRDAPLSGDSLYGDRENLRRYRDNARDEHRRFWSQQEREQQGGIPRQDALTEYDIDPVVATPPKVASHTGTTAA